MSPTAAARRTISERASRFAEGSREPLPPSPATACVARRTCVVIESATSSVSAGASAATATQNNVHTTLSGGPKACRASKASAGKSATASSRSEIVRRCIFPTRAPVPSGASAHKSPPHHGTTWLTEC